MLALEPGRGFGSAKDDSVYPSYTDVITEDSFSQIEVS